MKSVFLFLTLFTINTIVAFGFSPSDPKSVNYFGYERNDVTTYFKVRPELTASSDDVKEAFKNSDIEILVVFGEKLLASKKPSDWPSSAWPPGIAFVNAKIIKLFHGKHFILANIFLSIFLWTIALFALANCLPQEAAYWKRVLFVSAIWVFPFVRVWSFGIGTLMGESKAFPLFVLGMSLLFIASQKINYYFMALAGLVLALSAYFRVFFDLLPMLCFLPIIFGCLAYGYLHRREAMAWVPAKLFSVCTIAFLAGVAPWKVHVKKHSGAYNMLWGIKSSNYAIWTTDYLWRPEERMSTTFRAMNTACVVDPEQCQEFNRPDSPSKGSNLFWPTVRTFLKHPYSWIAFRASNLHWFWFGQSLPFSNVFQISVLIEGIALILIGFLSLAYMFKRLRPDPTQISFPLFFAGFLIMNAVVFTLVHFEQRYSAPLKLLLVCAPFYLYSIKSTVKN